MKLKVSSKLSKYILFYFVLFIYIYAPPLSFVPLGINKLIAPLAIVWLLFCYKTVTQKILLQKHLFIAIFLLAVSIVYAFATDISTIYAGDLPFTKRNTFSQTMILVELLPIVLFLSIYAIRKLKFNLEDFLNSFVVVAAIQSFIAITMMFSPGLRMFIFTTVLGYDPSEEKIFQDHLYAFRSFGFSQDLLFSLSIVQGIAIACVLNLCLYNFSKYRYSLFLIPPLLVSILLNARIGLAALVSFVVVTIIFGLFRLRVYLLARFVLFALVSTLIISLSISSVDLFFDTNLETNVEWALKLFGDSQNFASGSDENIGNFKSLTGRYWHLPDTPSARTFGEGRYLSGAINSNSSKLSDLGYVRKVYFGGYIYSFLSYAALICLFIGSQKKQIKSFQPFFYSILLTMLLVQFKGDAFLPTPGYRIAFLVLIFAIVERRLRSSAKARIDPNIASLVNYRSLEPPSIKKNL